MTPFPYPVGATVAGADCIGRAFAGKVTEQIGPYTVKLDGIYVTPVSLIHSLVEDDCPLGEEFGAAKPAQNILENITAEPAPEPPAQMSMF